MNTLLLMLVVSQVSPRFSEPSIGVQVLDFKAGLVKARETGEPPTNGGVFVVDTVPYSPAAKELGPYDLIMYVNGSPVESSASFNALVKKSAGDTFILTVCRRITDAGKKYDEVERVRIEVSTLGKMLNSAAKLDREKDGRRVVSLSAGPIGPLSLHVVVGQSGDVADTYVLAQRVGESRVKLKKVEVIRGKARVNLSAGTADIGSTLLDSGQFCETSLKVADQLDMKMLSSIAAGEAAKVVFSGENGEETVVVTDEHRRSLRAHLDMHEYFRSR